MPRNGSGTFNRIYNWTTDAGNGIDIEPSRMDGEFDGLATGLSNSIAKDGQTTITANIPFNSKKITALANGSARTDSIALGQVQDGTYRTLGTIGGSADTYTATPSPAITAYATGSEFNLKVNADNTGASTLNVNAVAAKAIKKYDGAGAKLALEAGDLQQDQYYKVIYDGTDFILVNPEIIDNLKSNNLTINNKLNTQPNSATISSGVIAYTSAYMVVDTEGAAATDNLDTISGGVDGDRLIIRATNGARHIVLKHLTGNIYLPNSKDVTLAETADKIEFIFRGTSWVQVARTLKTDFLSSSTTIGYTYLPNGLILQWGFSSGVTANTTLTVSLPVTYPNAHLNGSASYSSSNTGLTDACAMLRTSTSQIQITNGFSGAVSMAWFSIGY